MSDFCFINIGGSGPYSSPGRVQNVVKYGGYSEYAKHLGPQLVAGGFTRLWVHNPGGHWPLFHCLDPAKTWKENRDAAAAAGWKYEATRAMWIFQWLLAESTEQAWADRRELRVFHDLLCADYGITEICYYFGGPYVAPLEVQQSSVEPFVNLENASFGFDHVVHESEFEACQELWKKIKRLNESARIYTEARPYEPIDRRLLRYVDGTVATADFDLNHKVGSTPEVQSFARGVGEYIRITDSPWSSEAGVTQAKRGSIA